MQTSVQTATADNGAAVEVATIFAPDGTPHTALGSVVPADHGPAVAYCQQTSAHGGNLTTWQGEIIGRYEIVSTWPVDSWVGTRMEAVRGVLVTGVDCYRRYHGRTFGHGMSVRLYPDKRQP